MFRLEHWKLDHKISLKNIEKNSPSERLLEDEGSPYLLLVENFLNFMIHPWKTHLESVLELHQQWWFLERTFLEGNV